MVMEGGPVLSSAAASEGQSQLRAALSSLSSVITGTMDINTNWSCSRAVDPDIAFNCGLNPEVTMAPRGRTWVPDLYGPKGHMILKTIMSLGVGSDCEPLYVPSR